jgi:hypothetical protein
VREFPNSVGIDLKQGDAGGAFNDGFFRKAVGAVKIHIGEAAFVDGEGAALPGAILIDAANRPFGLFDQERAFQQDFATISTLVAFPNSERFLPGHIRFSEMNECKSTYFPKCLPESASTSPCHSHSRIKTHL